MATTHEKVHDIDVETETKMDLQWEDYIGQDQLSHDTHMNLEKHLNTEVQLKYMKQKKTKSTFEAEVDGSTRLKPTDEDTSEWGDQPPVLYHQNPDPNGNGKVKQDVYGLCFKNMPEDMSWKKFWKYAGVDRKRVCGAMRVGKTDIIVFFKNSNQAQQCLAETKDKNVDDVESDEEDSDDIKMGGKGDDWWLDRDAKRAQFIDRMIVPVTFFLCFYAIF